VLPYDVELEKVKSEAQLTTRSRLSVMLTQRRSHV
jgi:hypothetical protein